MVRLRFNNKRQFRLYIIELKLEYINIKQILSMNLYKRYLM